MKKVLFTLFIFCLLVGSVGAEVTTTASIDGADRVITIELRALQANGDNLANYAARKAYELRWIKDPQFFTAGAQTPYDSLSNAQKLSVLGLEAQWWFKVLGKAYYINGAVDAAKTTAESEADNMF